MIKLEGNHIRRVTCLHCYLIFTFRCCIVLASISKFKCVYLFLSFGAFLFSFFICLLRSAIVFSLLCASHCIRSTRDSQCRHITVVLYRIFYVSSRTYSMCQWYTRSIAHPPFLLSRSQSISLSRLTPFLTSLSSSNSNWTYSKYRGYFIHPSNPSFLPQRGTYWVVYLSYRFSLDFPISQVVICSQCSLSLSICILFMP